MLEVNGQRKRGRPKQTWRREIQESAKRTGLEGKRLQIGQDGERK